MTSVLQLMISKVQVNENMELFKNVDMKISDCSHTIRTVRYQIMKKSTKIFVLKQ